MKKISTALIMVIAIIGLTACSYECKSIDDCIDHSGKCYYTNESVRNENSELSNSLSDLLLDDTHNMSYHYDANPIDDILWIEYEVNEKISHQSFNDMIALSDDVYTLVNNLYTIADVEFSVSYLEDIEMSIYHDNESNMIVTFEFNQFIIEDSNELDDEELVNVALEYIDDYSEQIKTCLDYEWTTLVSVFNVSFTRIYLEVENDVITYRLPTRLTTEEIESKLLEVLSEYSLVKYIED